MCVFLKQPPSVTIYEALTGANELILPDADPISPNVNGKWIWDTSTWSEEKWLAAREGHLPGKEIPHTLGGSSVGTAINAGSFACAPELWCEKMGIELPIEKPSNPDILWTGHNYEEPISQTFLRVFKRDYPKLDIKMFNDTRMFQCGIKNPDGTLKYPWLIINPDRILMIEGIIGIGECKSTNFQAAEHWKQKVLPMQYDIQCRVYMATLNKPYAIAYGAWGLQCSDLAYIIVKRDLAYEELILSLADKFIKSLEAGEMPSVDDCDKAKLRKFYTRYYGEVQNDKEIYIPEEFKKTILKAISLKDELDEEKKKVKSLEENYKSCFTELYPVFKGAGKGSIMLDDGHYAIVEQKNSMKRAVFNAEKFKEENPDLYEECCNSFSENALKEQYPDIYEKFLTPAKVNGENENSFKIKVLETKKYKKMKGI